MLAELLPRTVVAMSIATALVALAIALDLPRLTPEALQRAPVRSSAEFIERSSELLHALQREGAIAAERAADPALRAHAALIAAAALEQASALEALAETAPPSEAAPSPMAAMAHENATSVRRLQGLAPEQIDRVFAPDALEAHHQLLRMASEVANLRPPASESLLALAAELEEFHRLAAALLERSVKSATPAP